MSESIIRLGDCPSQRWKNGLGSTREVAVHPLTVGCSDFLWRASLAEVDSTAPFSRFPGIDRHIVLLDGAGFTMTLDDNQLHPLTTPFEPLAFPGEARVGVQLAGGPSRDFNLMVQRSQARGDVVVWRRQGYCPLTLTTVLVHAARGEIDTADGTLRCGDSWRPAAPSNGHVLLREDAVALMIRIERNL